MYVMGFKMILATEQHSEGNGTVPGLCFYGIHVKLSSIQHADAGLILFSTQHFAEKETIEYCYGSFVFSEAASLFDCNRGQRCK